MARERILILEDNPENSTRLASMLERLSFEPVIVASAPGVLDSLGQLTAAAIVVDVALLDEGGVGSFARRLAELAPGIYRVFTGAPDLLARSRADEPSVECYLAKPYALPILKKILAGKNHTPSPAAAQAPPPPPTDAVPEGAALSGLDDIDRLGAAPSSPELEPSDPLSAALAMEPVREVAATDGVLAESGAIAAVLEVVAPPVPTTEARSRAVAVPEPDIVAEGHGLSSPACGAVAGQDLSSPACGAVAGQDDPPAPVPAAGESVGTELPPAMIKLHRERRTGTLEVRSRGFTTRIHVEDGAPVHAEGGAIDTTLGRILLKHKFITEGAYRQVLAKVTGAEASPELLGEALMAGGQLTASRLHEALARQVEEKIVDAFGVAVPDLTFLPMASSPSTPGRTFRSSVEHVVLKGIMRHGEMESLVEHFKPLRQRFPCLSRDEAFSRARLSARLQPVFDRLDGTRTIEELADGSLLAPHDLLKLLYGLALIGSLELREERNVVGMTGEQPVVQLDELSERVLRELLGLPGKTAREVLGVLENGSLSEMEVEDGYARRRAELDLPRVERECPPEIQEKARELLRAYGIAREALLDPTVEAASPKEPPPIRPRVLLSAEYYVREGLARRDQGDVQGAIAELERATTVAPDEPEYAALLSDLLLAKGRRSASPSDLTRARELASEALAKDPRLSLAYLVTAELDLAGGDPEAAKRGFQVVLRTDPHDARALRGLQEADEALHERRRDAPRLLSVASDLLFDRAASSMPPDLKDSLTKLYREGFAQTVRRHFTSMFRSAGLREGTDYVLLDASRATLVLMVFDDRILAQRAEFLGQLLSFPTLLRETASTRFDLHMINARADEEGSSRSMPRVRLAIAIAEGRLDEGARALAPARALDYLALDSERFTVDEVSAQELAGTEDEDALRRTFADLGHRLRVIEETARDGPRVFVVAYDATAAPAAIRNEVQAPKVRKAKAFVRSTRRVQRHISSEELGVLHDIREESKLLFEKDLATKFNRIKEEEDRRRKKSVWQRVLIGEDAKVDAERHQIKTHIFAPLLGDARVYMGKKEFRRWFTLMEQIGTVYMDALAQERDTFVEAGRVIYAGLDVDQTFHDFEEMTDARLLGVSEALSLFTLCIDPDEQYDEITLNGLARVAGRRFESAAGAIPRASQVLPVVHQIFRRAIDTPDDSVEPVNIWQWATLLALVGVTQELERSELDSLDDTYVAGSRKHRQELERIEKTFGEHLAILKGGLHRYHRIRKVLRLRSPLTPPDDPRGIFERNYDLPLFDLLK